MKNFFCGFYFDASVEEFMLHGIFSKREDADAALAEEFGDSKSPTRAVVELSLDGVKQHVLRCAVMHIPKAFPGASEVKILMDGRGFPAAIAGGDRKEPL